MFQLLSKRDRQPRGSGESESKMMTTSKSSRTPEFDSSQVTQEMSYSDDEYDDDDLQPSVVLLSDYESEDSLDDGASIEQYTSTRASPTTTPTPTRKPTTTTALRRRRGGLRHRSSTSTAASVASSHPPHHHHELKVTFAEVQIRRYAICVGDNPAVSLGVPISIDWTVMSEEIISVDDYEQVHAVGKGEAELAIPADERDRMVRQGAAGATTEEIRRAVRAVNTVKMEREKTLDTLQNAASELFLETIRKSLFNATIRRQQKKTERAQLKELLQKDAQRLSLVVVPPAC